MLRSPLNRLGPSVDEVKRTVSPEFSQGRRNFGKGAAITGAALGTGVGVAKLAKHADEIIHGTKAGKAAGKAIAGDKWDTAVQAIYDADRAVGMRGVETVRRGAPPGANAAGDPRPGHLMWLDEPHPGTSGRDIVRRFNDNYDLQSTPEGRAFLKREGDYYAREAKRKREAIRLTELNPDISAKEIQRSVREHTELVEAYDKLMDKMKYDRLTPTNKKLLQRRRKIDTELSDIEAEVGDIASGEARMINAENGYDMMDYELDELTEQLEYNLFTKHPRWNKLTEQSKAIPSQHNIIKYDPNTIKYREARMRAMAKEHGDRLWQLEYNRLLEAKSEAVIRRVPLPQVEAKLQKHIKLNPDTGAFREYPNTPLSSVGAAMPLADDETPHPVTPQDILDKIK